MKQENKSLHLFIAFLLLIVFPCNSIAQVAPNTIKLTDEILESYTGRYALGPNFILTVTKVGDTLKIAPSGRPAISFYPSSITKFFDKDNPDVSVEFVNIEGKIKKVILNQQGRIMEAVRIEQNLNYNPQQKYTVEQLKQDFNSFRSILENNHPRLYEFTPKDEFDQYFDSLYASITVPMNEIQFRHLLLLPISKVHCGHTTISPSIAFSQYRIPSFQPFILYYEDGKTFIRNSIDPSLKRGTEVLSINGVPTQKRLVNLMNRVSGDGIHKSVQYDIMNRPITFMTHEASEWFGITDYDLQVIGSDKNTEQIHLKAASDQEIATIVPPPVRQNEFRLTDDQQTGILIYSNTNYPNDSIRNSFLNAVFDELKNKEVGNLIIDFRGNGGGTPTNAAYLLKYLMKNDFIYSNNTSFPEYADLAKPINLSDNRFKGRVSFLIDGNCFSSTGHMLSMVKYYNLGPLIGELSSATYSCNTNGVPYLLSNTGLILNCPPSIYETAVKGFDRALGIPPDFQVKNTLLDIIDGKDKVMEFALKH